MWLKISHTESLELLKTPKYTPDFHNLTDKLSYAGYKKFESFYFAMPDTAGQRGLCS